MTAVVQRRGPLAMLERVLANEWTGLLAFALLLGAFELTTWQAFLAIVVFVSRTSERPQWLKDERAANQGDSA